MDDVVGVSHECDFPKEAKGRPRVTRCPVHNAGLSSRGVDDWVRRALRENGTIYTIDEPLMRELRPDVILTQKLCDVCAVGYGTVARLAQTLPGPPRVVNLEPTSLSDIFDDIRRVGQACGVCERADSRTSAMLFDGVGRSTVLFRPLGTGIGRDRRRIRSVRPQTSAVG